MRNTILLDPSLNSKDIENLRKTKKIATLRPRAQSGVIFFAFGQCLGVLVFPVFTGFFKVINKGIDMKKVIIATFVGALALPVLAQMTPVGVWRTYDDNTKELSSEVRISENGGVLSGKIEKLLRKDAKQDDVCEKCSDARKGKPLIGLEIIRGAKKADGKNVWEEGQILDPENGKDYSLNLTPVDGGKTLDVRGYLGLAVIGRSQTWVRVQ
jgi:uncharacterized protein (DUF2147 family)